MSFLMPFNLQAWITDNRHLLKPPVGNKMLWNGDFMAVQNRATTPSDYSPFCVTAPVDAGLGTVSGSQICGLYDVSLAKFGQVNNLTT